MATALAVVAAALKRAKGSQMDNHPVKIKLGEGRAFEVKWINQQGGFVYMDPQGGSLSAGNCQRLSVYRDPCRGLSYMHTCTHTHTHPGMETISHTHTHRHTQASGTLNL